MKEHKGGKTPSGSKRPAPSKADGGVAAKKKRFETVAKPSQYTEKPAVMMSK